MSCPAIITLPPAISSVLEMNDRDHMPDSKLNFGPVIGILSHPSDGASGRLDNSTNASYIAASYVKFVESAGARVIPLIYNEPPHILQNANITNFFTFTFYFMYICFNIPCFYGFLSQKLNLVNGVLLTGGWAKTGLYFEVVERIFKQVMKKNDEGDYFPLFAICLGFELLTMIISKDDKILERFNASHHASSLQFMKNINIEGTMFQRFSSDLLSKMNTDRLVMHHHKYGMSPQTFQGNMNLRNFFRILTTSTDKDNKVYVSTVQSQRYPVTGVQWHPEKNAFEWGLPMIPHSDDAIQVTQHFANFFVSEARKSSNRPPIRKVLDNLIYNYNPTYCGKAGRGYDEVYIFIENLHESSL